MSRPTHDNGNDNLELGRQLSGQRSRTSEAELQQEAVRWDSRQHRYGPEPPEPSPGVNDTATSTLVGDATEHQHTPRLHEHTFSPLGKADEAGEKAHASGREAGSGALASRGSAEPGAEPIWVEWGDKDPENPYNWSTRRRWITTVIVTMNTFICSWCGASFGSGNPSMEAELGMGRELAALALAGFPFGFALAPLVLAPLSETFGRRSMYTASGIAFMCFTIGIAFSRNYASVIIFRFLGGLAASPGSTLVGGSISDLWLTFERDTPMSCFSLLAFLGTGAGQIAGGWIEQNRSWRYIQYVQIAMIGAECVALTFFTQETRGSYILSQRAAKLRQDTGDARYQCKADAERASVGTLVRESLSRPIVFLMTEPIVTMLALWFGFAWGILFMCVEAVPLIMQGVYGFNSGQSGTVFISVMVAGLAGVLINRWQEHLYVKHFPTRGVEARLYVACYLCWLFPGGIFIVAFSQGRGHWMGPVVGLTVAFAGVYNIYLATFNFLGDCYLSYASSAMSGQSLWRNLCAGFFPLFCYQMYQNLGYQNATALAGALASLLAAAPWLLFYFGPKLRAKSKFASAMKEL